MHVFVKSVLNLSFLALAVGSMSSALAQSKMNDNNNPEQIVQDVLSCRSLLDGLERLTCLDATLPALALAFPKPQLTGIEQIEVQERQAEQKRSAAESAFGRSIVTAENQAAQDTKKEDVNTKIQDVSQELEQLSSIVIDVKFTNTNKAIVYLENGQVWQQSEGDSISIRAKSSIGETATLKKKLLGSYMLKIANGRLMRVSRIK